ncbi:MAG: alpha/beta fold hydrolase [Elusimicrobiales bacterium]|jgi:pimeloyl-ACP methyl ester carboxylesterase
MTGFEKIRSTGVDLSAVLVFLTGAAGFAQAAETVHFNTADGCRLEAFYQAPSTGSFVFVNAHGLGSGKNEWRVLETELKKKGYGYLSLDFRGHGGSRECGGAPADYRTFDAAAWSSLSGDLRASADFLKEKGVPAGKLLLCGASIGANLSLKAVAEGLRPAGVILLSPGLVYAGVGAEESFRAWPWVPVFIAASRNDDYSWRSSGYLTARAGVAGISAVFRAGAGGHGVNMLTAEERPGMIGAILNWAERIGMGKTGSGKHKVPR